MTSGIDLTRGANLLDYLNGNAAAATITTPIRFRHLTANGTGTSAGTELATGGGYTSGTGAPTVGWASASTSTGTAVSNTAVTTTNMPSCVLTGLESWTSDATPKRELYTGFTSPMTINAGDTFTVGSGSASESIA